MLAYLDPRAFILTPQPHFCSKAAFEKARVRIMSIWCRRTLLMARSSPLPRPNRSPAPAQPVVALPPYRCGVPHKRFGLKAQTLAQGPAVIKKYNADYGTFQVSKSRRPHLAPCFFLSQNPIPRRGSQRRNSHGNQFPVTHNSPGGELHGAEPTSDPALHPAARDHPGPPVAGHPFPRPHSKPHSEQQKKRLQRAAMSCNIP